MKESRIFQGRLKPEEYFVGCAAKSRTTKDKFGELGSGTIRDCCVNTRWGQLHAPISWIGKKVRIIVVEVKKR